MKVNIMSKINIIYCCSKCSHHYLIYSLTKLIKICGLTDKILDEDIIPSWCPLEDYEETSKEKIRGL
jgi:hypothetical protein